MNVAIERMKMRMDIERRKRWAKRIYWDLKDDLGEIVVVLLLLGFCVCAIALFCCGLHWLRSWL